jgi:galactose oxidase-like protein
MRASFALELLLLGAAVHANVALAQSPGTFTVTGKMITPRSGHTTTLLPDGRVLIAGGDSSYSASDAESSAELYDPVSETFLPTGSMTTPRDGHTATLLPNGKVLIAGGGPRATCCSDVVTSAEIYDPATGTFTATGSMSVARGGHTATLLNDGKVLIAGGGRLVAGLGTLLLAGAELYDPATGTFTATGDMHEPYCDTATLLPSGKVLITRGYFYDLQTDTEHFVRHAELYDPSAGTFAFLGDTITGHFKGTATLLMNGKVLIAGGDGYSVSTELYDPATGTFAATGNLTTGRGQHAAVLLPDGTVLLGGGHGNFNVNPDNLASAEIYNPATGVFRAVGAMITGGDILGAALLNDGRVLITGGNQYYPFGAGGRDPQHPEVSIAELYTPPAPASPPVLLSLSGQGAILHASTHELVSPDNPGVADEALEVYLTGFTDGSAIPPQVAIGGRMAGVLWFGNTPGYVGLNQVNVRVPTGTARGPAVSVRLNYLGRPSNEVTIGVK